MAEQKIKVYVLVTFYDETGLHKAGSVTEVFESEFNSYYMKKIEGGGGSTVEVTQVQATGTKIATITVDSDATDIYAPEGSGGSVIDNIQLTDDDQVDSMDIDNNTYYFSTVGSVGINSDGKVTSVVLNDTEQEFTSIDNIQVDSEYCTKSFDLNGDTVSFVSIENIEEDSENKVKQFDFNGATKEFTSIENISTQGPSGEVDSMDINGTSYSFATGGGGSLIVTLTGGTGVTVDLMNMTAPSSIHVHSDKTYAEIKAADEIIFKITDNVATGGFRWTFRPVGMYTLNVPADQALVFTFSAFAANQTLKEFRLEISPWGTFFTLYCMA